MVLTSLVQSIQRLFRNIREATMVSCGGGLRDSSSSPVEVSETRAIHDRSFMGAARLQPLVSRNPSSKRKLDELDVGTVECSVRPRREEPQEMRDAKGILEDAGGKINTNAESSEIRMEEVRESSGLKAHHEQECPIRLVECETEGGSTDDSQEDGCEVRMEESREDSDGSNSDEVVEGGSAGWLEPETDSSLEEVEGWLEADTDTEKDEREECDWLAVQSASSPQGEVEACPTAGGWLEAETESSLRDESDGCLIAGETAMGLLESDTDSNPQKKARGCAGGWIDADSEDDDSYQMEVENRSASGSTSSTSGLLQFFVRTYLEGYRTLVLFAMASDTVESVHQQILSKTGLPILEQRLIFCGRQLQHDQTLGECGVTNDATLNLVGRMRSTALPHSWQLINDLVSTIRRMQSLNEEQMNRFGSSKLRQFQDSVRNGVQEFLKMASKSVPVTDHMQVFQLSGATSALVMLLIHPVQSNRVCAEDSINFFLTANEEYLPTHLHAHSAPVLLDFCKVLARSVPDHSIYPTCRNALARLLDTIEAVHTSPYFNDMKPDNVIEEFAPFVDELATFLLTHLKNFDSSRGPCYDFSKYIKEAKDFNSFITHLCTAMECSKPSSSSGSDPDYLELSESSISDCSPDLFSDENFKVGTGNWLEWIFHKLLEQIDKCLSSVASEYENQRSGVGAVDFSKAPFLFVLKGLHAVAKLCDRAKTKLVSVLQYQRVALNVLIRQSRWQEDDFWLLQYKFLLDFESKKRLVMAMLPEPQDDHDERQEIVVHRSQLLQDSLEQLAYVESEGIQGGLSVEFASEEATGPGVLREWFFMVCKEIFNPQFALFLPCPNDRRRFFPNPASGVNPGHLTYFKFCGRVIALAMMHRVQIDVMFAVIFFKMLAGTSISWEDAKDADPALYASCKEILEMDADAVDSDVLGLTFVTEMDLLGSRKTLELCPGGKDIPVTSSNRSHFVELLVQRRLVASVTDQVKSFSQGFSDLLVNTTIQQFLRPLEPEDLDLILYGRDRGISLEDWKRHTEYHDYTSSDMQTKWFWQVVEGMSMERRRRLLFFATSITHLPPEGFAGLSSKFHIHRAFTDLTWLPTAHTCFYQLILPPYPSYDIMYRKLYAITADHISEGFGFA